jgi:hypothetical protein
LFGESGIPSGKSGKASVTGGLLNRVAVANCLIGP